MTSQLNKSRLNKVEPRSARQTSWAKTRWGGNL